ncbi:MAG: hypothetical protein IJC25_02590 [Clostridia bacterium]|nr:hypothetical protein [Clostridia bacterium]
MKKKRLLFLLIAALLAASCGHRIPPAKDPDLPVLHPYAQATPDEPVEIPDPEFFNLLLYQDADRNGDGIITCLEASLLSSLGSLPGIYDVSSIEGIRYFTGLTSVWMTGCDISDISELEELPLLHSVALSGNRIPCSVQSGIDPQTQRVIEALQQKGVVFLDDVQEQCTVPGGDAAQAPHSYKILVAAAPEVDMLTQDGKAIRGSLTQDDLALVEPIARNFEQLAEKLLNYTVDIQLEFTVLQQPLTGTARSIKVDLHSGGDSSIRPSDVPELRDRLAQYDMISIFVPFDKEFHRSDGIGGFDPEHELGFSTLYWDSAMAQFQHNRSTDYNWAHRQLTKGFPADCVYYMLHEFVHAVEGHARFLGMPSQDYHSALAAGRPEQRLQITADYLNGRSNGIDDRIWSTPPRLHR